MTNATVERSLEIEERGFMDPSSVDNNGAVDPFYNTWTDYAMPSLGSVPRAVCICRLTHSSSARELRKLYPNHAVLLYEERDIKLLGFKAAVVQPLSRSHCVSSFHFVPNPRHNSELAGRLDDKEVKYGAYRVAWNGYNFLVYTVTYPTARNKKQQFYLLHDGPEQQAQALLMAAGSYTNDLHEEILVFDQGFWSKNHELWAEIQKANWDDVILKENFKNTIMKDVNGFFDSEKLYKSLSISWKRGLIMFGPPGNGKTIAMKAIMKECDAKRFSPLYVKSLDCCEGDEQAMQAVFNKARGMAPCVLVLEDLDSLINDRNRSFFLNQLDGLEGNDGLLVIASTNHIERLDQAITGRPSRFDRKYEFSDPDQEERALYARYWQRKLENKDVAFPDTLAEEIAAMTANFSFAYLKEAL
ncbi:nucleoside triphosphate hydrolase protein [Wolfiporia cocos MD-104 SS10]|uniref:Nucleoside triphosphate hydrolase protein n=1 Tax=Wolfiporia cocos (strain MD-104) TaxID=742152 RepID=A0A2H3JIX2_WOLCO|nr:nucleoside triphosphate hydrolase protein [Wolfiporia cocos MD-104 SS10]